MPKRHITFIFICLFAGMPIFQASATSYMGTVLVSSEAGQPCFHVKNADLVGERFQLKSLEITELIKQNNVPIASNVWVIGVKKPLRHVIWPKGQCVRYGVLPQSFSQHQQALLLTSGKIYHVAATTTRDGESDRSSVFHLADFCMLPTTSGMLEVKPILWDESAQRWRTEVCDSLAPSK